MIGELLTLIRDLVEDGCEGRRGHCLWCYEHTDKHAPWCPYIKALDVLKNYGKEHAENHR